MKKETHPTLFETDVTCACGTVAWKTISTREKISVEICSACHPAWTGEQRIVDSRGPKFRLDVNNPQMGSEN